jgi:universal stress protein F
VLYTEEVDIHLSLTRAAETGCCPVTGDTLRTAAARLRQANVVHQAVANPGAQGRRSAGRVIGSSRRPLLQRETRLRSIHARLPHSGAGRSAPLPIVFAAGFVLVGPTNRTLGCTEPNITVEGRLKKVLVALDGSSRAAEVLTYAAFLARLAGARMVLFRSVEVPPDMRLAWPLNDELLEERLCGEAEAYLNGCAHMVPDGLVEKVTVCVGTPWRSICAAARQARADLVVIGSHGYGGLDCVLGTTAAKVVNHLDRPLLVIRAVASG